MNDEALVSIIVPVYGTEKYLPSCVESLLGQTYSNLEIVLIDDGSPDSCPDICDEYSKKDLRVTVIHQKNKGVSAARNSGIDRCRGEYIAFVDSDDELTPNAVEILLRDATSYGADISSATKYTVDENGSIISRYEDDTYSVYEGTDALCLSLDGDRQTNSCCAKLFKKSFLEDIRFAEGKKVNEDGFFLFECFAKKPRLVQHNVGIYRYNVRQNSSSRDIFSEKYLDMLYFCDRKKEIITSSFPSLIEKLYNMEARTNLLFLQVLCHTKENKYRDHEKNCIKTVRKLYRFFKPRSSGEKKIAWIIAHGLFPVYKKAIAFKGHVSGS